MWKKLGRNFFIFNSPRSSAFCLFWCIWLLVIYLWIWHINKKININIKKELVWIFLNNVQKSFHTVQIFQVIIYSFPSRWFFLSLLSVIGFVSFLKHFAGSDLSLNSFCIFHQTGLKTKIRLNKFSWIWATL